MENVKFKGVVLQNNGQWVANIHTNNQLVYIGSFNIEGDTALAHDRAAIKFNEPHRSFLLLAYDVTEQKFQSLYSANEILGLISDRSYASKFAVFVKENTQAVMTTSSRGIIRRFLFEKKLTSSDVGKLSRVLLPKKSDVRFFPSIISEGGEGAGNAGVPNKIEMVFYDTAMRAWRFKYTYWKSCETLAFTQSWSAFGKSRQLRGDDLVKFYLCKNPELPGDAGFFMIDTERSE